MIVAGIARHLTGLWMEVVSSNGADWLTTEVAVGFTRQVVVGHLGVPRQLFQAILARREC